MVVFKDDPEKYNSPEMFLKIQKDMAQTMDLIRQINKMEEDILLNPMVSLLNNEFAVNKIRNFDLFP